MIFEQKIRIYNKTLEPNFWDEKQNLKPEIRVNLLKISKDFYKSTDFKSELIDILLLGSSVNYTWTSISDIDVHIVINITKEGLDPEHYREFLDCLSGKYNQEHNITIKGHKVEVYLQDITEKNSTPEKARPHGAIFSLLNNKWLITPKFEKLILDKDAIRNKFYKIKSQIDNIIKTKNVDGLKELMKSIKDYRNKGLESNDGEFSTENIVFKALRHTGMLEKLKNSVNSIYDRLVSLEEQESYLNKLNNLDDGIIQELIEETICELEEKDKSYTLIGAVDEQLQVSVMIKEEKIHKSMGNSQPYNVHKMLCYGDYNIDSNTALHWRYRSDINELTYYDYPSEIQSNVVKQYLKNNYKLLSFPKVITLHELNTAQKMTFHDIGYNSPKDKIDEIFNKLPPKNENFIVTGMISNDLDIAGEPYWGTGEIISHQMLKSWYGYWNNSISWRYRKDINTVFYENSGLSNIQKDIIYDFLKENFHIIQKPIFRLETDAFFRRISHFPEYYGNLKTV